MPTVFGISGYSGAGTKKGNDPKVTPEDLKHCVKPYSLTDHIHEREAGFQLSTIAPEPLQVAFVPSVAPWFSGIIATASIPLKTTMTSGQVHQLFEEKYAGEKLVRWQRAGVPQVWEIEGKHGWIGGGLQVHSDGRRVVAVGVLDNLLKGAATQCLQVSHF